LPPSAEQKRIVAKVDTLLALWDEIGKHQQQRQQNLLSMNDTALAQLLTAPTPDDFQHHWQGLCNNFDLLYSVPETIPKLHQAILQLAVQGKLVPQDPNDEPAETSIERVSKDAKKAIRDGIIRRHGLEETPDDSDLSELPFGWRWTRLVEVTRPVQYAIKRGPFGSAIRKDMFVPTGFKVYEQQHAISGDFTKGRYYVNEAKFEELSAFELYPGEILVSCSGTVGKVAIVPADIERGIINQALLKLSLHQSALLNEYFLILFPAFFMETGTLTNLSGTAQKNIPGMDVLKAMPFPLPPLAEQKRIVARVDTLLALCDALEIKLNAARNSSATLMDIAARQILVAQES
jgi:type I restriction enzyme S subunit